MTATVTPIIVTEVHILNDQDKMQELRAGLSEGTAWLPAELEELPPTTWDELEHPAISPWSDMTDEVIAEIAPDVARMLEAAIAKRLPWTWEPER